MPQYKKQILKIHTSLPDRVLFIPVRPVVYYQHHVQNEAAALGALPDIDLVVGSDTINPLELEQSMDAIEAAHEGMSFRWLIPRESQLELIRERGYVYEHAMRLVPEPALRNLGQAAKRLISSLPPQYVDERGALTFDERGTVRAPQPIADLIIQTVAIIARLRNVGMREAFEGLGQEDEYLSTEYSDDDLDQAIARHAGRPKTPVADS